MSIPALSSNDLSRVAPAAVDIERNVLSACLTEPAELPVVLDLLNVESFYNNNHREIYQSIVSLQKKGDPVNIITVTTDLRSRNKLEDVGGALYVTDLSNDYLNGGCEWACRILLQKETQRGLILENNRTMSRCYSGDDPLEVLSDHTQQTTKLLDRLSGGKRPSLTKQVDATISVIEQSDLFNHRAA